MPGSNIAGARKTLIDRLLDHVEKVGNRLPDPVLIFVIICALTLVASWLAALAARFTSSPRASDMSAPMQGSKPRHRPAPLARERGEGGVRVPGVALPFIKKCLRRSRNAAPSREAGRRAHAA